MINELMNFCTFTAAKFNTFMSCFGVKIALVSFFPNFYAIGNIHKYLIHIWASYCMLSPLQWHHYERDSVSNHQPHHGLLNRLFRRRSKKTSKLRVIGLCVGNSPATGEFPAQRARNAENVSIGWRHHGHEMESLSALPVFCEYRTSLSCRSLKLFHKSLVDEDYWVTNIRRTAKVIVITAYFTNGLPKHEIARLSYLFNISWIPFGFKMFKYEEKCRAVGECVQKWNGHKKYFSNSITSVSLCHTSRGNSSITISGLCLGWFVQNRQDLLQSDRRTSL